jgi:nucleoid DNA-binding protein
VLAGAVLQVIAAPAGELAKKRGTPMTKADLVEQVAGVTGLTKRDVGVVVDLLLETISKALCEKEHIEIRGFGSFKVKTKKARIARNPRTGAQVQVPAKTVPYFKASRELVKLIGSV